MNTEIFDYFKALSKKENFFVNFLCTCLSIMIILSGIISLLYGSGLLLYTIMFGCATLILWLNAFKLFKRGSKNGWVFVALGLLLCIVTVIGVYVLLK